jgi:hypothetical protein
VVLDQLRRQAPADSADLGGEYLEKARFYLGKATELAPNTAEVTTVVEVQEAIERLYGRARETDAQ